MTADDEQPPTRKWKILEKNVGDKWPIFTGDFEYLNEVLAEKPSNSAWLILQYLNSLMRSFGQVILANNPVSGAFIILAIGIADYMALLAGIYASTLSFIFALLLRQDSAAILNGGYGFNPVLHGVVSVGALPNIYPDISEFPPKFWLFLAVTSLISVYVTSALNSIFKHMGRFPVPCFSLPFNLVEFILIYCLLNNAVPPRIVSDHLLMAPASTGIINGTGHESGPRYERANNTVAVATNFTGDQDNCTTCEIPTHLNWGETFSGTIVAIAQVYGLNNIPCAALMYLALFIYSPIMTGFAYMGSLLGTILGILFTSSPEDIYAGVWGYNGLLCAAALGGFVLALNVQSTLLAFSSIIFSTILQHFLGPVFILMNFPILTMPFNITTILFLFITTENDEDLARPDTLTSPERHRQQYMSMLERPQGYLQRSQIYDGKDDV